MHSHAPYHAQQSAQEARIILLGASNLTMSLGMVIELMQHRCGGCKDVLVAAGHGRSYGQNSRFLVRELPGIISSGLWTHLESTDSRPTYAFLTDIGNDIPYGCMPEQILQWVNWCIKRLQKQKARIVITNVPIRSIESLSESRYTIFRTLFFPLCRLSKSEVVGRARAVHRGLVEMASGKHFELYEQEPVWFGSDAIHVHYWKRKELYRHIFERFPLASNVRKSASDKMPHFLVWKQRPQFAVRRVWGREYRRQQPSGQLTDGASVSLY